MPRWNHVLQCNATGIYGSLYPSRRAISCPALFFGSWFWTDGSCYNPWSNSSFSFIFLLGQDVVLKCSCLKKSINDAGNSGGVLSYMFTICWANRTVGPHGDSIEALLKRHREPVWFEYWADLSSTFKSTSKLQAQLLLNNSESDTPCHVKTTQYAS